MQRQDQRRQLIEQFNKMFSAPEVSATADRLGPLLPAMDALEIVQRLGLLPFVPDSSFLRYRQVVGIPAINLQILTRAILGALLTRPHPLPVVMDIVQGDVETVSVAVSASQVRIHLVRTTVDPLLIEA